MSGILLAGTTVAVLTALTGLAVTSAGRVRRHHLLVRRLTGAGEPDPSAPARHWLTPPAWFARAVRASGIAVASTQVWPAVVAGVIGGLLLVMFLAGPVAALVVAIVTLFAFVVAVRSLPGRDAVLLQRALPSALEAISRSLRAGASVRNAVAEAATAVPPPLADDLSRMARAADRGIPLREVLDDWTRDRDLPAVRLAAAALVLGVDAGSGLARSLDGVAATLYERAAVEREVRLLSTQARYSAAVLVLAPVGFLAIVAALDPVAVEFLFRTVPGLLCLAIGLSLDGGAAWWMARITRAAS